MPWFYVHVVGKLPERACSLLRLSQKERFRFLRLRGLPVLFPKQMAAHTCYSEELPSPSKIYVVLKITAVLLFLPHVGDKHRFVCGCCSKLEFLPPFC